MTRSLAGLLLTFFLVGVAVAVPDDDPESRADLERRLRKLEKKVKELEKRPDGGIDEKELDRRIEREIEKSASRGLLTFGGAEFRLGGKLEMNFVHTQSENDLVLGVTDNPDPHLILDRLRLEPSFDVGKKMEIFAQVDFLPDDGDSFLKEAGFVYEFQADDYWKDLWWYRSRAQIGLDDRFIHVGPTARVSESYPLIGTAFWRDEETALVWQNTFGKKRGMPAKKKKGKGKSRPGGLSRHEKTSSTTYDAFDFGHNPGALTFYFSIGDGYTLDAKSINKDAAAMQKIIQDDRETSLENLSLSSVGLGVGYERDFNSLGELEAIFFFYEDELNEDSVSFLQTELTVRGPLGNPVSGYGDDDSDDSSRVGVRFRYHLEGYHLLDRWTDTWPDDGLYFQVEWIEARDGVLKRDGWYVQASYRFSFGRPLFADRYLRSIEPVLRYGELDVRQDNDPTLPLTWDRRQFFVGAVFGISKHTLLKTEYAFLRESTGGGSVNNDELLIQLLLHF